MHPSRTHIDATTSDTPTQVVRGTLHIHDPHQDEPTRAAVDLLPTTIALTNTTSTHTNTGDHYIDYILRLGSQTLGPVT